MSDAKCSRRTMAGEFIGAACPDCGHSNLVHPGRSNPALESCVICVYLGETE